jgi:hypothetical protein
MDDSCPTESRIVGTNARVGDVSRRFRLVLKGGSERLPIVLVMLFSFFPFPF